MKALRGFLRLPVSGDSPIAAAFWTGVLLGITITGVMVAVVRTIADV